MTWKVFPMSDDILKYIDSPDPAIIRAREASRGKDGVVPKTACPHPASAIDWVIDDDPRIKRKMPTNLFVCSLCKQFLRLVDYNGKEAIDG
jgi:hypothetical protein